VLAGSLRDARRDLRGFWPRCPRDYGDIVQFNVAGPSYLVVHPDYIQHDPNSGTGRDATGYVAGELGLLVDGGRGPRERALGVKLAYERTEISGPVTERPQARHASIGSSSRPQSWMKVSSV